MGKNLRIVLLFFLLVYSMLSMAQTGSIVIKGTISDDKGITLPGVTVSVKDMLVNAISNVDGNYTITVPANGKTLVFSFIGMEKHEVNINGKTLINVILHSSTTSLTDVNVVAIGYGSQSRSNLSGAISSIKAADIANIPQVSIEQLMQGKAAGVTITQNSGGPGSSTSVHIRGITSLTLSNEPLYIIDGVPVSGDANNRTTSGRSPQLAPNNGENGVSPLSFLNPSDIESIDVLKDASATAIYGSRGSNGVIIITTKKGKNGSFRVGYDGYYGFQQQGRELPMLNLKQYASLQNALADVIGISRRGEFANPELLGKGTNWQDEIFKTAAQQSHQLSFSGAKDNTDYYISTGFVKQDGTVLGNDYKRYNVRANVNSQLKPWLKVGTTMSGSYSFQNTSLSNNTGIIYTALLSAPDQVVYNADGSFAGPQADQIGGQNNPVEQALRITNNLARYNFNGGLYVDLKLTKDLTFRSEGNGDLNFSAAKLFRPTYNNGPRFVNLTASLQEYNSNSVYWTWKEYLTYNHTFAKKHALQITAGHELININYKDNSANIQSFLSNDLPALGLGDAKTATVGEYIGPTDVLESAFARAIYTFNDRYNLTATFRADRSSKFAQGHQTGYFPSFGAFWRVSEEPFWKELKGVADNVKLRLGYGQTGNQAVPNYLYGSALNAVITGQGTGFAIDKIANPNLTWETAIQSNVGLDFSLFNGRIESSVDFWRKSSKNFLFQAALPAFLLGQTAEYSGTGVISPPYVNGGELKANGFDVSINTKNISGSNFRWNTSIVFSHYANRVESLYTGVPFISQNVTTSFLALPVTRTQVGTSVGEFYGYKIKDIFRTAEQLRNAPVQFGRPIQTGSGGTYLGDIQYEDINNDGKIDANDQTFIGNPNPQFTYGITNNFSYKAFDLSIFLNGSYGAKIFNVLNYQIAGLGSLYQNQVAYVASFWTPTNPGSNVPRPIAGDNPNLLNSDRFIENGSFLRVQNVSLGFTLPSVIAKKAKLERLRVYASGQNLYVFTPYKGLDPEIGSVNQNVFLSNVDLGRFPIPMTIVFGINASF
ncbi:MULTISPECIES: TonB-dependent receptor [unclassified Mucilaginibacter]|uniref:SusC/RagA family TonB-linked outer membrane protein n=1 Tax=unclassified Mucilaginibacter TaxID=2617802 RepID=UPI002AC98343|nr:MULTISPECIES: TonB-dependent receptor [unclassified Mucilaginibacter]MEB0260354.1 TonB-dependent receptor [Mucilaginibacter sp. 10I4]MEB0279393.1 TonB-dependent receptor [Mucilaginibacter sp. 10B2]MEB0300521.1 TonB-dependent receptor [Mucilaginibacter sp. 5C4]WPX21767.1 TonB-dependent receptor [Mucilaginibacter sp. 5C4]